MSRTLRAAFGGGLAAILDNALCPRLVKGYVITGRVFVTSGKTAYISAFF